MKATGEVMAIDRTFGVGAQQGAPRPRAGRRRAAGRGRRPGRPTFDYLAGVYAGDPDADEPIRWIDEAGQACESTRHAQRTAAPIVLRRFLEPSDSRLWRLLGPAAARRARRRSIGEATGIAPWFLAEMGRNVALEARRRARRAPRLADPADAEAADAPGHGQAGRLRRPRARRPGRHDRRRAPGGAAGARPAARLRDGRHLRRRVRGRDAVLLRDLRRGRLARPRRRRSRGPAALVIGSGPVRIGQGIEFDYCAVQAADTLRRRGLAGGDDQLEPGDRLDRLRRLVAALLRAARPRERPQRHRRRDARRATTLAAGGRRVRRPDAAQPRRAARRRRRAAARLATSRPSTRPRSGRGSPRCSTGSASRSPRAAWPTVDRGGADARRAHRLPGHRPAVVRHRRPGHRLLLLARGPRPPAGGGDGRRPGPAGPHRPLPRGRRGRRRRRLATASDVLIPGLLEHVERAGVHSRRLGRRSSRRRPCREGDQELIVATMERIVLALGARGLVNAQFIVRDDGVYLIEVNPRAVADRAVPVQGHRRADGRAGGPDRARRDARRARLGRRPAAAAAVRRGQGAGLLDGQAARRRPVGRAGHAVDRRGHRHRTRTRASRWPRRCSGPRSSRRGPGADGALALLSIADRDKAHAAAARRRARRRRLPAGGDARDARGARRGRATTRGPSPSSARPPTRRPARSPILDLIASGEVRLVVNTPTPRSGAVRDAAEIRLAATAEGILCLTAMETAVAAAEALDPGDRRPARRRPLARRVGARAGAGGRRRPDGRAAAVGRPSASTTIAWPSDQSVSVVSADHHDGERDLAAPQRRGAEARRARRAAATTWPAHAPEHVPADDRRELDGPDEARRQPAAGRLVERGPEQVPALLERVGDRDEDAAGRRSAGTSGSGR